MMTVLRAVFTCSLAAASVATGTAAPAPAVAAGRDLVQRHAGAIVGIELVVTLRMKMGDREVPPREQRVEVNGTVISPTGLTVTTLAAVDPQATMDAMRANSPGGGVQITGSDFKEVKLRLADGREVPARFVLKDADLDLAFMAPEGSAGGRDYPYVKLEDAADAGVLDVCYFVARAPKTLQRVPVVRRTEVMGIVEKPRRLFLMTDQTPGTPVFNEQGKVLGITFQHFANGRPTGLVLIPAADIAEMSKQAVAAQAKGAGGGQP